MESCSVGEEEFGEDFLGTAGVVCAGALGEC